MTALAGPDVPSSASAAPPRADSVGNRLRRGLLVRTPLGMLVRWVARIPVSVHTKLLTAFLLVTALFFAMGAVSFRIITGIARQSVLLDQAHARVGWSRQIEHALAMQMHFTSMALLAQATTR